MFLAPFLLFTAASAVEAGPSSAEHRIIITTPQRCGSHFLSKIIYEGGSDLGIFKGSEQHPTGNTSEACWSSLTDILDRSKTAILHMNNWCSSKNPFQFLESMGERIRQDKRIKVLHGHRSSLMVISNQHLAKAALSEFGGHIISNPKHGLSAAYHNLTLRHQLPTSDEATCKELAKKIRTREAYERSFLDRLSLAGSGQLLEYEYEGLILPQQRAHLAVIFQFLTRSGSVALPMAMAEKVLGSEPAAGFLHPPTCSSRVTDWPRLRAMINGTYTQVACDRLEEAYGHSD